MKNEEYYLNLISARAQYIAEKMSTNSAQLFNWRNKILKAHGIDLKTGEFNKDTAPFLTLDTNAQKYIIATLVCEYCNYQTALDLASESIEHAEQTLNNNTINKGISETTDDPKYDTITIRTDGASRGNPGPASTGFVLLDTEENIIHKGGEYIGTQTNNYAEYMAPIHALEYLINNKQSNTINIQMDSELVVKQLTGVYKVKNESLKPLYNKLQSLLKKTEKYTISHIPRSQNKIADEICNQILDNR